jgi:hypothetical protein
VHSIEEVIEYEGEDDGGGVDGVVDGEGKEHLEEGRSHPIQSRYHRPYHQQPEVLLVFELNALAPGLDDEEDGDDLRDVAGEVELDGANLVLIGVDEPSHPENAACRHAHEVGEVFIGNEGEDLGLLVFVMHFMPIRYRSHNQFLLLWLQLLFNHYTLTRKKVFLITQTIICHATQK